uniref:Putative ovule protein n=1 Tax=Solanum chacoense TaxID=4108 RepID=A0A0V0HPV9_SOLCH
MLFYTELWCLNKLLGKKAFVFQFSEAAFLLSTFGTIGETQIAALMLEKCFKLISQIHYNSPTIFFQKTLLTKNAF